MSEQKLSQALGEYLEHLREEGKSERTLYTYGRDAEQIIEFFGADRKLTSILTPHVGKFLKSDILLKLPNDKCRAELTVKKTIRVLRMFFIWAHDRNYITSVPLPKNMPMGRGATNESTD